jgi:hypothetical protein
LLDSIQKHLGPHHQSFFVGEQQTLACARTPTG